MPEQKFLTDLKVAGTVDLNNLKINTAQGTDGQVLTSTGTGVGWEDSVGVSETAERIEVTVKNISGGSLSKGTVVHTSPSANPPNGNVIEVIAADYDNSTKMPAIGILNETIANEAEGSAVMMGALSGINTSSFSIGDELYVGNLGTLTNSKPTTAGQLIQKIAVVIKSHASNGLIKIFGAGRSNDVPLPLYIDNTNQRVGIGDPTPSYTLDVNGTIYGSGVRSGRYYGTSGTSSYLDLDSGAPYSLIASSEISVTDTITCNDLTATEPGGIAASSGAVYGLRFYGYGNTTYYVDPNDSTTSAILNGKVGIGVTDPDSRLDVNAGVSAVTAGPAVRISKGASPVGLIRYDTLVIEANDVPAIRLGESDGTVSSIMSGDSNLRINSTHPIKFYTDGTATGEAHAGQGGTFAMIIDNSQNVGIGTTSPGAKLHVNGNVTADRYYGNGSTTYYVDPNDTGTAIYTAGDIRTASTKGFTSDGLGKLYAWRAVDNTTGNSTNYVKIARLTGTAGGDDWFSDRCIIELAGRSSSYSNNELPAMGYIVAQLQSDANWDVVYYNHHNGSDEVVDEVGVVQINNTQADIYVRVGAYAEVTASGHISDGHIAVDNTRSGSAPSGYSAANAEYKVWNSGNDGTGSGLDADLLDGNHASAFLGATAKAADSNLLDGVDSGSFLRSDVSDTVSAGRQISFYSYDNIESSSGDQASLQVFQDTSGADAFMQFHVGGDFAAYFGLDGSTNDFAVGGWSMGANKYKVWHAGNDGSGSGLDADKLDNLQGSYYDHRGYTIDNNYLGGYYVSGGTEKPNDNIFGAGKFKVAMLRGGSNNLGFGGTWNDVFWLSTYNGGDVKKSVALVSSKSDNTSLWIAKQDYDSSSWGTGYLFWNSGNDGSGSGLDADLLDGQHASAFAAASHNHDSTYVNVTGDTMTGQLTATKLRTNHDASQAAPRFDTSFYVAQSQHYYGQNGTQSMYIGETGNDVLIRGQVAIGGTAIQSGYALTMTGQIDMNAGNIHYLNELHFNDNVRFYDDGNDNYLNFKWGDTGPGGIKFLDGNGNLHGYVYGSSNDEIGFLDADGNWAVRIEKDAIVELRVNNSQRFDCSTGGCHFRNGSSYVGQVTTSGVARFANDVVAYYSFSDKRLKTDIKATTNNLDKILKLEPVEYTWKDGGREGKKEIGLIAQDVEKVVPEVVRENERLNDDTLYKQIDYEHLVSTLIGAVQEQQKQIDELKSIINGSS